jgi:uncharacterized cupin superfamily protein
MDLAMTSFNLDRAPLEDTGTPEGFKAREASIGEAIGAEHLAGNVLEILPGDRPWPYHWESTQEEWLIVLSGTPTVRTPEGDERLAAGDVVCFVRGPDGAHEVRNASDAPCRVILLSDRAAVNVIAYPDSGKIGVRTPWLHPNFPESAAVGYWEGE